MGSTDTQRNCSVKVHYDTHSIRRKHLKQAAKRKKDVYNTKALVHKYLAGDIVWSLNEKFESMRVQRLEAQNTEVKQITTG